MVGGEDEKLVEKEARANKEEHLLLDGEQAKREAYSEKVIVQNRNYSKLILSRGLSRFSKNRFPVLNATHSSSVLYLTSLNDSNTSHSQITAP